MPRMTEHDRLAELEARERKAIDEAEAARRALRGKYADMLRDLAVERLSERELREIVIQAIRVGGIGALTALKGVSDASP